MDVRFKWRRNTKIDWETLNPTLLEGEPGLEIDTDRYKIGDGITEWNLLEPYYSSLNETITRIATAIANVPGGDGGGGVTPTQLNAHVNSATPHPIYDDGPSLLLLYQNAKAGN